MDFLRKLFSSHKSQIGAHIQLQLRSRHASQVNQLQFSAGLPSRKEYSQGHLFQNQSEQSSIANQIDTKILQKCEIIKQQISSQPDFGILVGVIGHQKSSPKLLKSCNIVQVGQSKEITSLKALRKKSLDSLVVYFSQQSSQFSLEQIILADQRLIFVVQKKAELQNVVSRVQKIICQFFQQKPLIQCLSYMYFSVVSIEGSYFIELKGSSFFLENFKNSLKKINIEFQKDDELLRLIKLITLKDYLAFLQCKQQVLEKLTGLKNEIHAQLLIQKNEVQTIRFDSNLSTCENQKGEYVIIEHFPQISSSQVDLEAEYFRKRMSQKKAEEADCQENIQNTDLFYLIQERDISEYSEDQSDQPNKKVFRNKLKPEKKRYYSKSQHAIESDKEEDLDQQFFNKY